MATAAEPNGSATESSSATIETIVVAVFHLPRLLAATTVPLVATIMRRPLTRNSRATTTMGTHGLTRSQASSTSSAATTSSLSAMGSRNLPKVVTSPRLRAR